MSKASGFIGLKVDLPKAKISFKRNYEALSSCLWSRRNESDWAISVATGVLNFLFNSKFLGTARWELLSLVLLLAVAYNDTGCRVFSIMWL